MIAAALIGKRIKINNIDIHLIKNEITILKKMGVKIKTDKSSIEILKSKNIKKINITTKPYPGFPTDLQAQLMVLMTRAKGGISKIKEDIFENEIHACPRIEKNGCRN